MLITEKQLIILVQTLKDTLGFWETNAFSFSREIRHELLDEILNQQSEELINVK